MARMGKLTHVFGSKIPFSLKMKVYKCAVCSLFTYGSEAWNLDEVTIAALNGANTRCLSRITARSPHVEASARTRTYDLVRDVRKRRHIWLGHILRMKGDRLLKVAVEAQFNLKSEGNLFMDVPQHLTFNQVQHRAQYRRRWKESWTSPRAYENFVDIPPTLNTQRQPASTLASDAASAVVVQA